MENKTNTPENDIDFCETISIVEKKIKWQLENIEKMKSRLQDIYSIQKSYLEIFQEYDLKILNYYESFYKGEYLNSNIKFETMEFCLFRNKTSNPDQQKSLMNKMKNEILEIINKIKAKNLEYDNFTERINSNCQKMQKLLKEKTCLVNFFQNNGNTSPFSNSYNCLIANGFSLEAKYENMVSYLKEEKNKFLFEVDDKIQVIPIEEERKIIRIDDIIDKEEIKCSSNEHKKQRLEEDSLAEESKHIIQKFSFNLLQFNEEEIMKCIREIGNCQKEFTNYFSVLIDHDKITNRNLFEKMIEEQMIKHIFVNYYFKITKNSTLIGGEVTSFNDLFTFLISNYNMMRDTLKISNVSACNCDIDLILQDFKIQYKHNYSATQLRDFIQLYPRHTHLKGVIKSLSKSN
jgi:hypothetical protein